MESYFGFVDSIQDARLLFEACRLHLLPILKHRLSDVHSCSFSIRSGSVFIWEEASSGIKRWRDWHNWSASRNVNGFLVYKEFKKDGKSSKRNDKDRIKENGLFKRAISIRTTTGEKFHLVSYYASEDLLKQRLNFPSRDARLMKVTIPRGYYLGEVEEDGKDRMVCPLPFIRPLTPESPPSSSATFSSEQGKIAKNIMDLKYILN